MREGLIAEDSVFLKKTRGKSLEGLAEIHKKKKSDIPTPNLMCLYPEILPQIWDFRCTRTVGLELTWVLLSRHRTTNKNPKILLSLLTHQKPKTSRCEPVEGAI